MSTGSLLQTVAWMIILASALFAVAAGEASRAAEGSGGVPPSAATLPAGDVAIGQPITLPAGKPVPAPGNVAAPAALPGAGTGWLGLTVDDAIVTGRLSVVDVAGDGPAAKAGLRPQDVLLALDGRPLNNDDELAAALAAIAPGQQVKAAVGRDNRVENLVITATPRPADPRGRMWQAPGAVASPGAVGTAPFAAAPPQAQALAAIAPARFPQSGGLAPAVSPPPQAFVPAQAIAAQASPPLSAVPPRSVLVQNAEPAPAAPAIADLPPSAFAQAPAVMTPATRFEAAVAPPPAIPLVSPSATPFAASSTAAVAEPPTPAPRRFGEPAGLLSAPIVPVPAAPFPRATASGRPALGVRTVPVDTSMQSRFRLPDPSGAFVIGVVHDLPASRAGVPPGSVIVAINERPVGSPQDLSQLVSHGPVGIPVSLTYVLPGGEAKRAEVVLQPLEAPLERALVGEPVGGEATPLTGTPLLEPTPAFARRIPPRAAVDTVVIMAGGTALPAVSLPAVSLPAVSLPAVSLPAVSLPAVSLPATSSSSPVSDGTITTGATAPPAESSSRERPIDQLQELLRRIESRLDQLDGLERRLEALEKIERGGR